MNQYQKKGLQKYKRQLNQRANMVSKMPARQIDSELRSINRMNLSRPEKQWIKGTIYKKLTPTKRRHLSSHFGQTSPQTQAAMTQAASTAAVTQAVTQAAMSSAPASSVAAMASSAPASSVAAMSSAPASSVAMAAPGQSLATVVGTVPTVDYSSTAGALDSAANAIQLAGQQLAAQGITGFGRGRY